MTKRAVELILLLTVISNVRGERWVMSIQSPNWPSTYGNNPSSDREIEINEPNDEQLSFAVRYMYQNKEDFIEFSFGEKDWLGRCGYVHTRYRGEKWEEVFGGFAGSDEYAQTCIDIEYSKAQSGDDLSKNKYYIDVYAYKRCPSVGSPEILTQPDLYLSSPLFPAAYPGGNDCKWIVQPESDPAQRIQVNIDGVNYITFHYLEISPIDGGVLHVRESPKSYLSDTNSITIRWNAKDGQASGNGWTLNYRLVGCKSSEAEVRPNAYMLNAASFYDDGHVLTYKCKEGWTFGGNYSEETVRCNGSKWTWLADGPKSDCQPVTCPALPQVTNGEIEYSNKQNYQSVAKYQCEPGYVLLGEPQTTCGYDGNWDHEAVPQCINRDEINCPQPMSPTNGHWQCMGVGTSNCSSYGSVQQLVCEPAYIVVGFSNIQCSVSGIWQPNESETSCQPIDCGAPPTPGDNNTLVTYNETDYQAVATYFCNWQKSINTDYKQPIRVTQLVCNENGTWNGSLPDCSPPLPCTLPQLANSDVGKCDADVCPHGTLLQAPCKIGYESTSATRTSMCINGRWSPELLDCTRICCEAYRTHMDDTLSLSLSLSAPYSIAASATFYGNCYNESVTLECAEGYELVGRAVASCSLNGSWTSTGAYCVANKCEQLIATTGLLVSSNCDYVNCVAWFDCETGYELVGTSVVSCDRNGSWSWNDSKPYCKAYECAISDLLTQLPANMHLQIMQVSNGNDNQSESQLGAVVLYGDTVAVAVGCNNLTVNVTCDVQHWDVSSLEVVQSTLDCCSSTSSSNYVYYCSMQQLVEVLELVDATATTVGVSVDESLIVQGTVVYVSCESAIVATAVCGAGSWEFSEPLSNIRQACN